VSDRYVAERTQATRPARGQWKRIRMATHVTAQFGISPSVQCPTEGCSFHRWVRLAGWVPARQGDLPL